MKIADYRIDAVHTFAVRTLRSLGFGTRVTLSNASGTTRFATDYRVDVTMYGPGGERRAIESVGTLAPGEKLSFDCASFVDDTARDQVVTFHLLPTRLLAEVKDGTLAIARDELYALWTAQDHYVEYFREDGFAAGVLYQSGAFNYDKFSREGTTLIQAPKVYLSRDVDTLLSLMNTSPVAGYQKRAHLRCVLIGEDGWRSPIWREEIDPYEARSISLRAHAPHVADKVDPSFFCLYGLCEDATMVPLTITRNDRSGAIAIEHALPPMYYSPVMFGPARAKVISSLSRAAMFREGA